MKNIKANDQKWIGQKFQSLTVVKPVYRKSRWLWLCKCDCGNETIAYPNLLINGKQKACYCGKSKTFHDMHLRHGESHTRLNNIWSDMKRRCNDKNRKCYIHYGGRGIEYFKEWENYEAFRDWAMLNGYKDELTLERKNVNGNYELSNCCWIPFSRQALNKRNNIVVKINGDKKCLIEWCREMGKVYSTIHGRIRNQGMTPLEALTK